jgi:hypothetical protein
MTDDEIWLRIFCAALPIYKQDAASRADEGLKEYQNRWQKPTQYKQR